MTARGTHLSSMARRRISMKLKGRTRRNVFGHVRTFAEFMHNNRRRSGR